MAKRFIDTELWDKEWFMKLSCKHKCLVKMVRDKSDLSGVWSPNWTLATSYVGESVTESDLLSIDGGKQFAKIDGGKIYCIGFIEFQYGELSEKSPVHRKIINILKNHKIDYKHPIYRVEEKEEEEDKEEEEVKEEEEGGSEIFEAQVYPTFDDFWNLYEKKIDRRDCEKKWLKLSQIEKEAIMEYLPAYIASTPDIKFRRHPETFLNNRTWENEIINGKQTTKTGKPVDIDKLNQFTDAMFKNQQATGST